jgi:hypothetical protein
MADTRAAERQVAESQSAQDKANADYYKAQENLKPTPTQRENDLAKMGVPVENKEPDGSEPQAEADKRAAQPHATQMPAPAPKK